MLATKSFFQEIQKITNEKLRGLPSFCKLVMFQSLQYCDLATGKIILPPLEDFAARDFYSAVAGQKREVINGKMLRSTLCTIKKCAREHFIFSLKNQRIEIELPFIRHLYEKGAEKAAQDIRQKVDTKEQQQPIPDNFCSNETTVNMPESLGYKRVLDKMEIQKFIAFNKAIGSYEYLKTELTLLESFCI